MGLGALLLALLVQTIGAGRAFDRRNPGRLVLVAACVLVGGLIPPMLTGLATFAVADDVGLDALSPVRVSMNFDFAPVLLALGLLVLAEAFRLGTRISHDVEGLV